MAAKHWEDRILNAVTQAARGDRSRLHALAIMLDDHETSVEVLARHGYGELGDSLIVLVAGVVETCGRAPAPRAGA